MTIATAALSSTASAVKPRAARKASPNALPKLVEFDLVRWQGHLSCGYMHGHRILGGKPWGGGESEYTFNIRTDQLQAIIQRALARGAETVPFEVYRHENGEYATYVDNELMAGKRYNSRSSRPRRVGSVLVMLKRELPLKEFTGVHPKLMPQAQA